ncbi:thermonuclease family protein [Consotaella aegiceratis]|uniref:thermonuclease family protein n=1 Tax=Consotaella aegiceratis TaxID=3097961 RepID=UPI002F4005AD
MPALNTIAISRFGCIAGLAMLVAAPAAADDSDFYRKAISGPVEASVVDIYDGDTMTVEAFIWPMQSVRVAVRLRGVDTPELRGKCASEKLAAQAARDRLRELVGDGPVRLTNIAGGKYYGRVVADITTAQGTDVGGQMLIEGFADAYDGKARRDWCAPDAIGLLQSVIRQRG